MPILMNFKNEEIPMARKLVTIRIISDLLPIVGADLIETAVVDGWKVVVKKGEFQIGDAVVYCEIDSWIPTEVAPFLTKPGKEPRVYNGIKGEKLKTVRLRGQLSQGLILPIESVYDMIYDGATIDGKTIEIITKDVTKFKFTLAKDRISIKKDHYSTEDEAFVKLIIIDLLNIDTTFEEFKTVRGSVHWGKGENSNLYYITKKSHHNEYFDMVRDGITKPGELYDVTKVLGFQKWEPILDASLVGSTRGLFPSFIQKTDEERIQNLYTEYSEKYKDNDFRPTLKLDGTSCTYYVADTNRYNVKICEGDEPSNFHFGHCSRNLESKEGDYTPWKIARDTGIKDTLIDYHQVTGRSIALQGELMGPSIQGNRENLRQPTFFLFKIWDIDDQRYLTYEEKMQIVTEFTGQGVDLNHVPTYPMIKIFTECPTLDDILEYADGPSLTHKVREGIVFEMMSLDENGNHVSFKAINNKFLLNEKD